MQCFDVLIFVFFPIGFSTSLEEILFKTCLTPNMSTIYNQSLVYFLRKHYLRKIGRKYMDKKIVACRNQSKLLLSVWLLTALIQLRIELCIYANTYFRYSFYQKINKFKNLWVPMNTHGYLNTHMLLIFGTTWVRVRHGYHIYPSGRK